ncbi:MAG: hypothetical protein OES99_09280, partial [Gammaproteobacteria bacterium]|nr:hypothetical protein [Gammaproteobacteria bacterium]
FEARKVLVTRYRYRAEMRVDIAMRTVERDLEIENMLKPPPKPDEHGHYYFPYTGLVTILSN